MPTSALTEDEFRLLAYIRAYSDRREPHLDPTWVQEQLEFSVEHLRCAARVLVDRGLAEFFEFDPPAWLLKAHPELGVLTFPMPGDICLTENGWNYLPRGPS